jgi:hypothetical protein
LAIISLVRTPIILALLLLLWLRSEDLRRDLAQYVVDTLRLDGTSDEANHKGQRCKQGFHFHFLRIKTKRIGCVPGCPTPLPLRRSVLFMQPHPLLHGRGADGWPRSRFGRQTLAIAAWALQGADPAYALPRTPAAGLSKRS